MTLGGAIFDPRGMTGRIYVKLHMTLLLIKYTSFVSCGCRDEIFFLYFHYKSMVDIDWGTVGRIYEEEYYTLLPTKYESSGSCGFGEEDFFMFFHL